MTQALERTFFNLRFIDEHAARNGPYEVTQLINSFLGAAVHPWENVLRSQPVLVNLRKNDVGWPMLQKAAPADDSPLDLHEELAWIRHAFAHGNITYLNTDGEIWGIDIRNNGYSKRQKKQISWGVRLGKETLRQLLDSYAEIARRVNESMNADVGSRVAS